MARNVGGAGWLVIGVLDIILSFDGHCLLLLSVVLFVNDFVLVAEMTEISANI